MTILFLKLQKSIELLPKIRAPQSQTCSPAWRRIIFSHTLVLPDNIHTSAFVWWLYRVKTRTIMHVRGWCVRILMLLLRIGLHTLWWQNVCVPCSWSVSLTHADKRCGEKEHESLNVKSPGTLRPWTSNKFGKQFYRLFFLLFPCLGLYNFPVFIWHGLVCRVLWPPRKGTLLRSPGLFYTS